MNTPSTSPTPQTPDPTHPTDPSDATPDPAPETRPDATLADEMFVDDGRTAALPTSDAATAAAPGGASTALDTAPAPTPAPGSTTASNATDAPEQEWLTGPAPFALVLGLLGLLVAGSVLVGELTDVTLPWGDLGPWSVVAAGLVVLLVGAIGLRSSRTRD